MRNHVSPRQPGLILLFLLVSVSAVCRAAVADEQQAPNTVSDLIRQVRNHELEGTELTAAIPKLVKAYTESRQSVVLQALAVAFREQPAAIADHVPVFAQILRKSSKEQEVCDVLQMLIQLDTLPAEFETAVSTRFQSDETIMKMRAAAVLIKFWPKRQDAQQWLEESLTDDDDQLRRLNAAVSFGSLGRSAIPSVPLLRARLVDLSAAVRVAAAGALLAIEPDGAADPSIATVLIESLQSPEEAWITRPFFISEWLPSHRLAAIGALSKCSVLHPEIAGALIGVLSDDDEVIRLYSLKALAALGESTDQVKDAVHQRLTDSDGAVAEQAAITLEALNESSK
jgi:hypothetical protein